MVPDPPSVTIGTAPIVAPAPPKIIVRPTATTITPTTAEATSTVPASAVAPFKIKIKSFAQVGGPPLSVDGVAMAGGELATAGSVVVAADCQNSGFFRKYRQTAMWHRVVVNHRGAHTKAEILSNLRKELATVDIYPCYYVVSPNRILTLLIHLLNEIHSRNIPSVTRSLCTTPLNLSNSWSITNCCCECIHITCTVRLSYT